MSTNYREDKKKYVCAIESAILNVPLLDNVGHVIMPGPVRKMKLIVRNHIVVLIITQVLKTMVVTLSPRTGLYAPLITNHVVLPIEPRVNKWINYHFNHLYMRWDRGSKIGWRSERGVTTKHMFNSGWIFEGDVYVCTKAKLDVDFDVMDTYVHDNEGGIQVKVWNHPLGLLEACDGNKLW